MRRDSLKNGYILVYVFLIGLISIFLVASLFSLQVKLLNYNKLELKSKEKVDLRNKYKENLFTLLNENITKNKVEIDEIKINEYLKAKLNTLKFNYDGGKLTYENNMIVLNYRLNNYKLINEYYEVRCENGQIKYDFVYKAFVGG